MSERAHDAPAGLSEQSPPRDETLVHAYHDGELRGLARWRFERRLRREPALRRELTALAELRALLRAHHRDASPELWDDLAPRLSAARARRAEPPRRPALAWVAVPGAAAATAALVLAIAQGWLGAAPPPSSGVVRWLDGGERNVVVLEGASDTTIIWVLDAPAEGARWGGGREAA